jgi:hypothetical protein
MKPLHLLVVAVLSALAGGAAQNNDYTLSDGQSCSPEGSAKRPEVKALNRDKNRFEAPSDDDIDADVTLAAMLAPGEDEQRFDQKRAARIVGFVVDVKVGGRETCNCGATNPIDRDTHLELALTPDAPPNQRIIVEVTPRLRKRMKASGIDWRTQTLQSHGKDGIKGKWIEVTGWLLFDIEHTDGAENSTPGNPRNWRASCWEIHPIIDLRVLDHGAPANTPVLSVHTLHSLQQAHVLQLRRDKTRRDAIETRNKENRAKFADEVESQSR